MGFFVWANYKTQKNHKRFTRSDVVKALEELVSSDSYWHDNWELFLIWKIDDSYLESVRQRCLRVVRDYPPETSTEEISKNGLAQIRLILEELRTAPKPDVTSPTQSP